MKNYADDMPVYVRMNMGMAMEYQGESITAQYALDYGYTYMDSVSDIPIPDGIDINTSMIVTE